MKTSAQNHRLSPWERAALLLLLLAGVVGFGVLVELRTAFLSRRMGDLGCYTRAAWAVRTGHDLYQVTDNLGWHYNYPPLLAILLTPLAEPPVGADNAGMMPFAVSAGVWYALGVLFIALGVHSLAKALEDTSPDPEVRAQPVGCRRWWALRLVPVLVCLPPLGHSLMRGQVNSLVLALVCGLIAAALRGRGVRAGFCLAGAVCVKVIPAFLLLYPLWQRDRRCLAGTAAGLVVGLGLVPAAVFGVPRTVTLYREYAAVTLAPGLGAGSDMSRAAELTEVTATDSQSFVSIFHNTLHPDRNTRPAQAGAGVRLAQLALGGVMTVLVLFAAGRRRAAGGLDRVLLPACLVVVMLLLSPVCHLHYFALLVPLVMGLAEASWRRRHDMRLGVVLTAVLAVYVVANTLPHLPGMELPRDLGLATYGTLTVWAAGVVILWKGAPAAATPPEGPAVYRLAAWERATVLPAPVYEVEKVD